MSATSSVAWFVHQLNDGDLMDNFAEDASSIPEGRIVFSFPRFRFAIAAMFTGHATQTVVISCVLYDIGSLRH